MVISNLIVRRQVLNTQAIVSGNAQKEILTARYRLDTIHKSLEELLSNCYSVIP